MGSNRACCFGKTTISSELDLNRAGWSCPDVGSAWPKGASPELTLYFGYFALVLILIFPVILISCGPTVVLCVYCFDVILTINKLCLNKAL